MSYTVVRSARKTLAIEVGLKGVTVRAPLRATDREICEFVEKHREWIEKHTAQVEERKKAADAEKLTPEDIHALAEKALTVIPERVKHYAPLVGVKYGRITIRNQRTKWGSCSGKGNLNFNCLLMLTPPEVIDSVVVHELCHLKEMNHSQRFYDEVLRVFPDYYRWNKWLRENGAAIMARMVYPKSNA